MKKLTLNKTSIQLLDNKSLVDLKGGLAGPITAKNCQSCDRHTCNTKDTEPEEDVNQI